MNTVEFAESFIFRKVETYFYFRFLELSITQSIPFARNFVEYILPEDKIFVPWKHLVLTVFKYQKPVLHNFKFYLRGDNLIRKIENFVHLGSDIGFLSYDLLMHVLFHHYDSVSDDFLEIFDSWIGSAGNPGLRLQILAEKLIELFKKESSTYKLSKIVSILGKVALKENGFQIISSLLMSCLDNYNLQLLRSICVIADKDICSKTLNRLIPECLSDDFSDNWLSFYSFLKAFGISIDQSYFSVLKLKGESLCFRLPLEQRKLFFRYFGFVDDPEELCQLILEGNQEKLSLFIFKNRKNIPYFPM